MTQQAGFGFTLKIKQLILKNNIENADEFKFFKCKTKLLEKKAALSAPNQANRILKMQYLNIQGMFEDQTKCHFKVLHYKDELKFRWTKHCVLSVLGAVNADNDDNANSIDITFIIKETKLYISIVSLSAKDKKLSKLLSKDSERSVYWNEYKTKSQNKDTAN